MGNRSIEVVRSIASDFVSSLTADDRHSSLHGPPDRPATLMPSKAQGAEERLGEVFIAHAEYQNGRLLNTMRSPTISELLLHRFSRPGKFCLDDKTSVLSGY